MAARLFTISYKKKSAKAAWASSSPSEIKHGKVSLLTMKSNKVWLKIFDALGRHVKTLMDKKQAVGSYSFNWDAKDELGKDVASGIYYNQLHTENFIKSRKMLLLR